MPESEKKEPVYELTYEKNGKVYSRIMLQKKPKLVRRTDDHFE